jgi:hypothetical protein
MEKQKYNRIKILGVLVLVFLAVPLLTASASAQSSNNNYMRSFPYGAPTLYQHNNMSYIGPFYPPAPYGMSGDSDVICGPYGCAWNSALNYLPQVVIAEQAW